MNRLRALVSLSRVELRSLGLAWLCLLVAGLALRVLPLPQTERLLSRLARLTRLVAARRRVRPLDAGRLAHLVGIAARHHLFPLACLPQSLALQALLLRQGSSARLRIGVCKEDGALRAHAWVEHAGLPVANPEDIEEIFLPLAPLAMPAMAAMTRRAA